MRVMAQMAMVMNLDKCIGCHTCSVTCKQAWTNRAGTEYVWFNNVETRPGLGYPRGYEDQEEWQGGWVLKNGRLSLRAGGRFKKLLTIFSNPKMPSIQDYYEPLLNAPTQKHFPVARPHSLISGKPMNVNWSANWDDDLGGSREHAAKDQMRKGIEDKVKLEFEQTFMFYLPRICEHCLNPRLAHVHHRLPLQEGLLQPPHRQGREVHVLLPPGRGRHSDRLLRDMRRTAALHRPGPL